MKEKSEEEAVDHGDNNDNDNSLANWMNAIAEYEKRGQERRKARIAKWAKMAGPPHTTATLGDDPGYMDRIGFWKIPDGVFRIRSSKKGEFDPSEGVAISGQEIKAMMNAFGHSITTNKKSSHEAQEDIS